MILWPEGESFKNFGDVRLSSCNHEWWSLLLHKQYAFSKGLRRNAQGVFKLQLQRALTTVSPQWSGARGRLQGLLEKQGEWICTWDSDLLKRKQVCPRKKEKALILLGIRPITEYSCGSPRFCRMWHSAMVIWKHLVCARVKAVVVRKAALIWWREQFASQG